MKTIAIDTDVSSLNQLDQLCKETDRIKLAGTFSDADAAGDFVTRNPVDLIIIAVNGSAEKSLEFCRKHSPGRMVVLTSTYRDHAVDAFDLRAVDYLLKPFTPERFMSAVDRAWLFRNVLSSQETQNDYMVVREKYSLRRIYFNSIVYVEALDDYVRFHFTSGDPLVIRMTMKTLISKLPANRFYRVHRSYIISLEAVTRVKSRCIFLGDLSIPIGERYEEEFLARFGPADY